MCPAVMLEAHNAITDRLSIISEFTECSGGLRAERGADTMEQRAAQLRASGVCIGQLLQCALPGNSILFTCHATLSCTVTGILFSFNSSSVPRTHSYCIRTLLFQDYLSS